MAATNCGEENPTCGAATSGESFSQTAHPAKPQGKELFSEFFKDLDVLNSLQNALFSEALSETSTRSTEDAGVLKARPETLATKRPKRGSDHSKEVVVIDPEQVNQGDESFDASNENDFDTNSASRWQASEQLASFLGTLHKPLSAFERKTICHKFPWPGAYLSSLVPGVKTADKENRFLLDRLLESLGPLSIMYCSEPDVV